MQVTKRVSYIGSVIYRAMNGRYIARTCTKCKAIKPASQFTFSLSNRSPSTTCKVCETERLMTLRRVAKPRSPITHNKNIKTYRQKNAARSARQVAQIQVERYPDGKKECTKCQKTQPLKEFHQYKGNPDGLSYHCKTCFLAYKAAQGK